MVDVNVICEECFLDKLLNELPNKVAKPTPAVKGKNLTKIFHQLSDSLKEIQLQYTCVDASSIAIALGTNVGNAFIYQRVHKKIVKISSETKYVPTTCIRLASGCTTVAFGHESGTFSVGLVDPPIHRTFESLTAQDIHHSNITCLEWSTDGLILYAGDSDGKISMSVVKISEGILQTAIIVTEDCSAVQLCYAQDALLISTIKRTILWPFQTEIIVQIGEKERKTSGGFGGCFIPDTLEEPTKKLYAARPGLRIWTADGKGKVSSTSVFKTLLADKPQVIRTLTGNDGKVNSGGQFGKLILYYNQYVATWDQNHLWVLDIHVGNVIGCHSNLGKIRDVAVCGHELFVLVNTRERFLRRFTVVTERVLDSSVLDAVVAKGDEEVETETSVGAEKSGFDLSSALMSVPFMSLEDNEAKAEAIDDSPELSTMEFEGAKKNIMDQICAIPLDEGQSDIVFTAAKKKKKKKKPKQSLSESQSSIDVPKDTGSPAINKQETTQRAESNTTMNDDEKVNSNLESCPDVETALPDVIHPPEELVTVMQTTESKTSPSTVASEIAERNMDDCVPSDNSSEVANTNDLPSVDRPVTPLAENITSGEASDEAKTISEESFVRNTLKIMERSPIGHDTVTAKETSTRKETLITVDSLTTKTTRTVHETFTEQDTTLHNTQERLAIEPDIAIIGEASTELSTTSRQDSADSTDVYLSSSDYLRLDSHEEDRPHDRIEIEDTMSKPSQKDHHVPLLADTWSKRTLPTSQTIEQLAISQKYIFCVDVKSRVYFSDPSTASCVGWEKVDFKAKEIYVNSSCDFMSYVDNGKAYVRGNVNENPVGKASFQILDGVSLLSTCSSCTWAITAGDTLRRADSVAFTKLKGNLKSSSFWKIEDSVENLSQIVCYDNVLWARNQDEIVQVYTGRCHGQKTKWEKQDKKAKWLHMSDDGMVWIITPDDQIWFKPNVTALCPTGEAWHQVTLGQYIIDDSSLLDSTVNFFYTVGSAYRSSKTTEYLRNTAKGLLQSTKDMASSFFRDGGSPKQIYCNINSGLWLLDTSNALHACRGQATGAFWEMTCPTGTAKSATWRDVTTGLAGFIWAMQPNGDLTCFHPGGRAYNVEGPTSSIDFISGSPHGLWCFASEKDSEVYMRDGISESYPQGFAWTRLSLRHQEMNNIKHLSVGRITVWAVDIEGNVWIRIGTVNGDESTALSQAWLQLDCPKQAKLASVVVNARDSMVWAIDTKGSVYSREGVKENMLVGTKWRVVEGVTLQSIFLSSYVVYGLCTTGEIVCRFGVSEKNCIGDYWKKIPGNFPQISVNSAGELWAISSEEKLFSRKMKYLEFSRDEEGEKEGKGVVIDDSHGDKPDGGDEEGDWELL